MAPETRFSRTTDDTHVRAALDAVGSERVVPIGLAHGGALCSF